MQPSTTPAEPDVQTLLRDLLARAEAAEAKAAKAESENARLTDELAAKDATIEAQSVELASKEKLVDALMARIDSLTRRLARAEDRSEQLALEFELKAVQRRLNELNREQFGQTSERRGRGEANAKPDKPAKAPQTGHGPTPHPDLPRDPQTHLLDEADRVCPKCVPAREMTPWKDHTVDSEEVTVVERTFRITVHKRQVYRCGGCGHLDTALGPDRLLTGGRYSVEFAATVAADKYARAQPLASQVREMADQGLTVTTQTLWDQLQALYVLLLPAYLLLHERVLESPVVYADETSWRLMQKGKTRRWWVWCVTDAQRVVFQLAPTRGQAAARQLLRDYDGVVMADRYKVYETLERERSRKGGEQVVLPLGDGAEHARALPRPDYTLAACWMHGRRGFIKAARHGEAEAETALDLIAELYAVEAEARARAAEVRDADQREAVLLEARRELRDARSRRLIQQLRAWLDRVVAMPELPLDKAVRWLDNGWVQLTRFLDDPRIPLDNGLAERVIRGVVLGRKTYAGSRSEKGTMVAALFYSLVQSCRVVGVDPRAYMIEAARRAARDRSDVLLPEDYAAELAQGG